ncbi:Rrf2 family transcriptional regulator [Agarivorans sp. B2Z047]|uniref:RrF2 family transcriptional regulator n=1 Tax=Agarivorans sp. B2Z047 TaxID=2652721 RepID=UPI00128E7F66|nr:Rrf2 family transcriptional regulator [Agarivorans sp. B2Z047]MPW31847.1 Rrf2 family transcriptional regulator [Agarivorans sp. B2Z047]UQN45225.1 Rrf2 family transcriptional regulator [Agarivorans sp. B2Z047]
MHITRYTDYSLRVLIYLAINNESFSTISDIATSYNISKNHLMKIVHQLNLKGYLIATRGRNGGLKLNNAPGDINVGALVRELEDKRNLIECFGNQNTCVITPSCQLKHIFAQAQEQFYRFLDSYTLQDLIGEKHKLGDILSINVT